jgi:hypothetical protein
MKIQLKIIPDEPEELEHGLTFEMPAVPRVGDCLTISRPGQAGCSHFCVRGIRWMLDCAAEGTHHRVDETVVGTTGAGSRLGRIRPKNTREPPHAPPTRRDRSVRARARRPSTSPVSTGRKRKGAMLS